MNDRRGTERRGLGRGLSALMGDVLPRTEGGDQTPADHLVPVESITPNPRQPRRHFEAEALEELAASIRTRGILQPILVRPAADRDGMFEIVAGERRWRAAQLAQLHQVPVLVRDVPDSALAEIALIENIQRADLNPIEEANAYAALLQEHGHTQERLADLLGKSRSHVTNMLRLLVLPDEVTDMLASGSLSVGHARALVPLGAGATAAARKVVARGLSVRATEALAKREQEDASAHPTPRKPEQKDPDTRLLEQDITAHLGLRVSIDHRGDGGSVTLRYRTLEELDELCRLLTWSR